MFKNSGNAIFFCLAMYLAINLIVAFLIIDYIDLIQDADKFSKNIAVLGWMAFLWLMASIVILFKALFLQEKFDKKLKLGTILILAAITMNVSLYFS